MKCVLLVVGAGVVATDPDRLIWIVDAASELPSWVLARGGGAKP
jgi:hypothetical protein